MTETAMDRLRELNTITSRLINLLDGVNGGGELPGMPCARAALIADGASNRLGKILGVLQAAKKED